MKPNAEVTHFLDFYLLEGLHFALANLPDEMTFRRSVEKLTADVESARATFAVDFSRSILDYLLAAATGESRYAKSHNVGLCLPNLPYDRDQALSESHRYDERQLAAALTEIFEAGQWGSAYGGRKWAEITQTCLDFIDGKYSPIAFIDRTADLEHNGGCAFSKNYDYFETENYYVMRTLLNWKFSAANPATDFIHRSTIFTYTQDQKITPAHLTYTVATLLNRFTTIVLDEPPNVPENPENVWISKSGTFDHPTRSDDPCEPSYFDQCDRYYNSNRDRFCRMHRCENCSQLTRRLIHIDGSDTNVCQQCYDYEVTVCEGCSELYLENDLYQTRNDYNLCPSCYHDGIYSLLCEICDEVFYTYNWYRERRHVCRNCAQRYPAQPCPHCQARGHHHRIDLFYYNRPLCAHCNRTLNHEHLTLFDLTRNGALKMNWKPNLSPSYTAAYKPSIAYYERYMEKKFSALALVARELTGIHLEITPDNYLRYACEACDILTTHPYSPEGESARLYAQRYAARAILIHCHSQLYKRISSKQLAAWLDFALKACPDG